MAAETGTDQGSSVTRLSPPVTFQYLGKRIHSYDHAFCAKACVAAGAPVLFLGDGGKVYVVLTTRNAVPLPAAILDKLGIPGVDVKGRVVRTDGIDGLVIEAIQ